MTGQPDNIRGDGTNNPDSEFSKADLAFTYEKYV